MVKWKYSKRCTTLHIDLNDFSKGKLLNIKADSEFYVRGFKGYKLKAGEKIEETSYGYNIINGENEKIAYDKDFKKQYFNGGSGGNGGTGI